MGAIQAATSSFGVELKPMDGHDARAIERGVSDFAQQPNAGLIVLSNPGASIHRELITTLAARFRLPAIYPYAFFVTGGGLIAGRELKNALKLFAPNKILGKLAYSESGFLRF